MSSLKVKKKSDEIQCLWYQEIECPIRKEFEKRGLINQIIRPKSEAGSLFGDMLSSLKNIIPPDLQILPAYCNICHFRKEKEAKKHESYE